MPDNLIKPQVFLSYSREPRENCEFVRWLAGRLRDAGFDVPLEEKQAAAEATEQAVQAGIRDARHALFVITRGWLERARSRIELDLFAGRPPETHRRVAVRREPVDLRALGHQFQNMHVIPWPPDEPEPEARFWEVYCILSRTPLGAGEQWAEKGSNLAARPACRSRPALVRSAKDWTFLLTDAGPCYRLDRGDRLELEPLPDLDGCSAAVVDAEGTLVVGLYSAMVATLRSGEWEYRATDAPVLSLAATPQGVVVGDTAGTVTFCGRGGAALGAVTLGEPIVDLACSDSGLIALGGRGGLWRLDESGSSSPRPIAPREGQGRLVGLVETGNPGQIGAFSAERVALIDVGAGRISLGPRLFPEGIGAVVPCGRGTGAPGVPPLGILTDTGQLWLASADLKTISPVVLPGGPMEVVRLAPGGDGGLLAWTACRTLLAVGRDRTVRTLATGDAVLAYHEPDFPGRVAVVHWQPDRGVQVRRVRLEPTR